jgi:hypothetical protein
MTEKEICFLIEGTEFQVLKDLLLNKSHFFNRILSNTSQKQGVKVLMPDWVTIKSFQQYLDYVKSGLLGRIDLYSAQKILWLADFLNDGPLQHILIYDTIIPHVKKETVLLFLQDAYIKIHSGPVNKCWKDLYNHCLEFSSNVARFLFTRYSYLVSKLDKNILQEIIQRDAIKNIKSGNSTSSPIIEALKDIRECSTYTDLLNNEETQALEYYRNKAFSEPVFTWDLTDIQSGNFYKESPQFSIDKTIFSMSVWCFDHGKKLSISIRHVQSLHSPKVTSILSKGSIAALSCMVSISKDQYSNPIIIPLIIGSKNQNIIREIPQFESLRMKSLRIKLVAKLEYVYTSILTYLGKHPENLLNDDSIQQLSFENLCILLRYKHLNLKTEDQALDMLGKWVAKSNQLTDESISKLLETIRWDFISLRALINSMRSYAELKTYKLYQEIFRRELEKRAGSESILHLSKTQLKPRVSYKNSIDKDTFSSPEQFLVSLSELILELEYAPYEMMV